MTDIVWDDESPKPPTKNDGIVWDDSPEPPKSKGFFSGAADKAAAMADAQLEKAKGEDGQASLSEGLGLATGMVGGLVSKGVVGIAEEGARAFHTATLKLREAVTGEAAPSWGEMRQKQYITPYTNKLKEMLPDSVQAGVDLTAAPFVGGIEQIAEDFGDGWALAAQMSLAALGAKGIHSAYKAGNKAKAIKTKEPYEPIDPLPEKPEPQQLEMDLPSEVYQGGKDGGILGGTKLTVDENGIPIDLDRTLELETTVKEANPDLFSDLEKEARRELYQKYEGPDPTKPDLFEQEKAEAWKAYEEASDAWAVFSKENEWKKYEDPKYARAFSRLVEEDSARSNAFAERELRQAMEQEGELRAHPHPAVQEHLASLKDRALRQKAPDLTPEGRITFDKVINLVSTVFPRMTAKAAHILPINMKLLKEAQADFHLLELVDGKDMANAKFLERYPEYTNLFRQHPDASGLVRGLKFNDDWIPGAVAINRWVDDKPYVTVLMDTTRLNHFAKNPAKVASILVHELIHARQFHSDKWIKQIRNEQAMGLAHTKRPSEHAATRGEETANVKFGEMFKDELRKNGVYEPSAIYPPGSPYRSPSSVRADTQAKRSQGAIGPGRRQSGHYDPEVYFGPIIKAGERMVQGMRAWWNKDNPKVKFDEGVRITPEMETMDLIKALGKLDKDIINTPGLRTSSYAGVNPLIGGSPERHKSRTVAAHWLNKVKERLWSEHARNYDPINTIAKMEEFYGVGEKKTIAGIPRIVPRKKITLEQAKNFAKDVRIALWFEKNPDQWFDKTSGQWYPDESQLIAKGMSPEAAKHWRAVFDIMEKSWSTLERALIANGQDLVKRIPGYLPHVISGPYRAVAYIPGNGKSPKKFIAEFGAHSRKEMNQNLELMRQHIKEPGVVFKREEPSPGKHDVAAILEGLHRASAAMENKSPGLLKLTQMIEENAAKSIISHALDRGNPTRFGHSLERAANYGKGLGFNERKQMTEAVEVFRDYIKAVNGFAERAKLVNETLIPLEQAGFLDAPNLNRFVMDYFKSYVNIAETNGFDVFWKSRLADFGLDPALYSKFFHKSQSGSANYFLLFNTPFYAVNSVQATASLPIMFAKQAQAQLNGEKVPSVRVAMSRGSERLSKIFSDEGVLKDPELLWAEKRGLLNPQAMEIADPGAWMDPISKGMDKITRRAAFLYGYEFWRQTLPREQALKRAGDFANEVAVPYSQQVGAPALLNKLGVVGRSASMFVTYSTHVLSMLEQNVRLIKAASEKGNAVAATRALGASITFATMQMALFGAIAGPMLTGINSVINQINDYFNDDILPTVEEVARKADQATGFNGIFEFGLVGKATGVDMTGAASGVSPQVPTAYYRFLKTLWEAAMLTKPFFKGETPTQQDVYEFVKDMPPGPKSLLNIFGLHARDYPDTTLQREAHEAGRQRTTAEQMINALGMRSIDEKSEITTDRLLQLKEARIANRIKNLDEKFKSQGPTEANTRKLLELAAEYDKDPSTFIRAYENHLETAGLSPEVRRALKINSLDEAGRYMRRQRVQGTQHTRP